MRITDSHCEGECYVHGKWTVKTTFTGASHEIVEDRCPLCTEDLEEKLEQVYEEGRTLGRDSACNEYDVEQFDKEKADLAAMAGRFF